MFKDPHPSPTFKQWTLYMRIENWSKHPLSLLSLLSSLSQPWLYLSLHDLPFLFLVDIKKSQFFIHMYYLLTLTTPLAFALLYYFHSTSIIKINYLASVIHSGNPQYNIVLLPICAWRWLSPKPCVTLVKDPTQWHIWSTQQFQHFF